MLQAALPTRPLTRPVRTCPSLFVIHACTQGKTFWESITDANALTHRGKEAQLRKLLRQHPDAIEFPDALQGMTLLHHAVFRTTGYGGMNVEPARSVESVKLLVEAGFDVNARSNAGLTPLMYAAAAVREDDLGTVSRVIVHYLIAKGADKSMADNIDQRASDIAVHHEHGNTFLRELLQTSEA